MLLELCLIVKDSGLRIVKALESWKPYIDYWTILDTGSTDGTQAVIKKILSDIPGQLYEEPRENFTFNCFGNVEIQQKLIAQFGELPFDFAKARNRSLELCKGKCHFIITIDDTYQIVNPQLLRKKLTNIIDKPHNACLIYIHNQSIGKPETLNFVQSVRIIRSNKNFRWTGSIHELLDVGQGMIPNITLNHDTYILDEVDDYHSTRSYHRHKRDIEVLNICFNYAKNKKVKARCAYYAAQTAIILDSLSKNDLDKDDLIAKWLKKRIEIDDESSSELYHVLTQYAKYTNNRTHSDRAIEMYPERIEGYLESALIAYNDKCPNVAYAYLRQGLFFHEASTEKEIIFISIKIDFYALIAKLALRYGHYVDAVKYIKSGLSYDDHNKDLLNLMMTCQNLNIWNTEEKQLVEKQTTSGYQEITISNSSYKRIVFATDATSTGKWDGNSNNVRGSETSIINIANMLAKLTHENVPIYEVVVFCNTPHKHTVIGSVIWLDVTDLESYLEKNYIDYFISVRSTRIINMLNKYVKTIRNHYFWIHDTGIGNEPLCLSQIAFRKMIYVSEFQKSLFVEQFKFPSNLCTVIPNSINVDIVQDIGIGSKIKNRFIYSSDANRGLYELLCVFPILRKILNNATLHIYCDLDKTDADVFEGVYKNTCLANLQKIRKMIKKHPEYITHHNRCSKNELYRGFASAEYWFYPCTFVETFCITAIEAQYFKCKVICNNLGALSTVVKAGIMYDCTIDLQDFMPVLVKHLSNEYNWRLESGYKWAIEHFYSNIIDKWITLFTK